jgi:hypothetical protein
VGAAAEEGVGSASAARACRRDDCVQLMPRGVAQRLRGGLRCEGATENQKGNSSLLIADRAWLMLCSAVATSRRRTTS